MAPPTPWRAWFWLGVTYFGLRPDDFWRLSLNEWAMLLDAVEHRGAAAPMGRAELDVLMARFPDKER